MLFREIFALIVRIIWNAPTHHAGKMHFLNVVAAGTKSYCQSIRPCSKPTTVACVCLVLLPTLFLGFSSPNLSASFIFMRHLFKLGHFSGATFTAWTLAIYTGNTVHTNTTHQLYTFVLYILLYVSVTHIDLHQEEKQRYRWKNATESLPFTKHLLTIH